MSHSRQPLIINFPFHGEMRTLKNEGKKKANYFTYEQNIYLKKPKRTN